MIFVFGSNLKGRHGKGAALTARQVYGAEYGKGSGRQGMSYAIPTKDREMKPIILPIIKEWVNLFLEYAEDHPELSFQVTKIGCGLAGYKEEQIKPMFEDAPANCILPEGWDYV